MTRSRVRILAALVLVLLLPAAAAFAQEGPPADYDGPVAPDEVSPTTPDLVGQDWHGTLNLRDNNSYARCFLWERQEGNQLWGTISIGRGNCNPEYAYRVTAEIKQGNGSFWIHVTEVSTYGGAVERYELELQDEGHIWGNAWYNGYQGVAVLETQ